jgi:polysaccharide deacetylase family protein (PEP-CTERM system associated)
MQAEPEWARIFHPNAERLSDSDPSNCVINDAADTPGRAGVIGGSRGLSHPEDSPERDLCDGSSYDRGMLNEMPPRGWLVTHYDRSERRPEMGVRFVTPAKVNQHIQAQHERANSPFLETGPKSHILTVMLEDYFHGPALAGAIDRRQWPYFETRFDRSTLKTLDVLDRFQVKATFFVMGWVAERRPDIVQEVVRRGHDVDSSGYTKKSFRHFTAQELRADLRRSREVIERASGKRVLGYRVADRHLACRDLWALEVLAQEGYSYDSSFSPTGRSFHRQPWRRYLYSQQFDNGDFWELPLSAVDSFGLLLPIAGGNYFRQLPAPLLLAAIERWHRKQPSPLVLYFRVWDFDPDPPRISSASWAASVRQYRNPDRVPLLLNQLLAHYRFSSAATYLGLTTQCIQEAQAMSSRHTSHDSSPRTSLRTPASDNHLRQEITIVVPCFNEALSLPYLAKTLEDVQSELTRTYRVYYVFVDDGSNDNTWEELNRLFGWRSDCSLVRQPRNTGLTAAILAGARTARTEVICSIDCDCSYDPMQLRELIPLLQPGIALVTASPYCPGGHILNVPKWRIALSRMASLLYRTLLKESIHTYTSCFRVYRRSCITNLRIREAGFLGVPELLATLSRNGSPIIEHPATLNARVLGRSKMKVVSTVIGHLRLLSRFAVMGTLAERRRQGSTSCSEPSEPVSDRPDCVNERT